MKAPLKVASLSVNRCAIVVYLASELIGCAAPPRSAGAQSAGAGAAAARESSSAETCATGWVYVQKSVCVLFSRLEQSGEPPVNLAALDLVSKVDYAHLGLRVAVFHGAEKWCAFPGVLSLSRIEANHEYAFKVPCPRSGTSPESGDFRLVVEVEEAIEMHPGR